MELNHTDSEEKTPTLLSEREVYLKKNICEGQATENVT
jgi:hypothetical protein